MTQLQDSPAPAHSPGPASLESSSGGLLERGLLQAVVNTSMLLLEAQSLEAVAGQVVEQIAQELKADRGVIVRVLPPDPQDALGYFSLDYEWVAKGIVRQSDQPGLKVVGLTPYGEFAHIMLRGETFQIITDNLAHDKARAEQEQVGAQSQFGYPIMVDGKVWGFLGADDCQKPRVWSTTEIESMRLVASALASVVKREQLIQARIAAELQRETAVLEERNRIARDIHDTLAQGFTGVSVQLQALRSALQRGEHDRMMDHVDTASQLTRSSLAEARESVYMLRTEPIGSSQLIESLEALADQGLGTDAAEISFTLRGEPYNLDPDSENALLRIAQESLANVRKHAKATKCEIKLIYGTDAVTLTVRDNGAGFDPSGITAGLGLAGMRTRAQRLGATLLLGSAPGRGTEVVFTLVSKSNEQNTVPPRLSIE